MVPIWCATKARREHRVYHGENTWAFRVVGSYFCIHCKRKVRVVWE